MGRRRGQTQLAAFGEVFFFLERLTEVCVVCVAHPAVPHLSCHVQSQL